MKMHVLLSFSRTRMGSAFALSLITALSGCTVISTHAPSVIPRPQHPAPVIAPLAGWTGTYRTVLPCAYCAGIQLDLTLYRDATYELLTQELGTGKPAMTRRGGSTVNSDETRIMLDANGQGRSFDILPPDRLRLLGRDGQPVTGQDAHRFILKK
mgnify:FL=1